MIDISTTYEIHFYITIPDMTDNENEQFEKGLFSLGHNLDHFEFWAMDCAIIARANNKQTMDSLVRALFEYFKEWSVSIDVNR